MFFDSARIFRSDSGHRANHTAVKPVPRQAEKTCDRKPSTAILSSIVDTIQSPTKLTVSPPPAKPDSGHGRKPHAVIIGSGFGGLAAAVRLGARGYRVTVLERLDAPGGRAYVHRQDGFTFDAGPTIITAPFLLDELWGLCGKRFADDVELRLMEPFYRIRFDNGEHFDYSGDPERIRAEIAALRPRGSGRIRSAS